MPVCSGTLTGARSMIGAAGRSIGSRWSEATRPLPSSARPSGSITRPSKPSPTATSITRPVRSTSSPACRCQYSPSSTTPTSSASTLNAMPKTSPGNFTSSSKPTPGRPDTRAMPVERLLIVPTSRRVNPGVPASRALPMSAKVRSKACRRVAVGALMGFPVRSGSAPSPVRRPASPAWRGTPRCSRRPSVHWR